MNIDLKEKLMHLAENEIVLLKLQKENTINAINPNEVIKGNDLYVDENIKIRKLSRFTYFNEHVHDRYIEFSYGVAGSVKHFINDKQVTLNEDNLLIFGVNSLHRTEQTNIEDMSINFNISIDYIKRLIFELNDEIIIDYYNIKLFENNNYIYIENVTEDFKVLMHSLIYYLVNNKYKIVEIKTFIDFAIKNFLVSSYRNDVIKEITDEHDIQHRLITYLNSNFSRASLVEFSEISGYSYTECSKLVKKIMNMNFKDVVKLHRLEVACTLLLNSSYSINKISRYIGYENINYFYKIFAQQYGCTPKEYRNNM